jgi:hypothetical protein
MWIPQCKTEPWYIRYQKPLTLLCEETDVLTLAGRCEAFSKHSSIRFHRCDACRLRVTLSRTAPLTETLTFSSLAQLHTLVLHHCCVIYDSAKDMRSRCSQSSGVGNVRDRTKCTIPLQSWQPYPLLGFHSRAYCCRRQTGCRNETFSWYYRVYLCIDKINAHIRGSIICTPHRILLAEQFTKEIVGTDSTHERDGKYM